MSIDSSSDHFWQPITCMCSHGLLCICACETVLTCLISVCVYIHKCHVSVYIFLRLYVQSRARGAARRPPSRRALRASGSGSDTAPSDPLPSSLGRSNRESPALKKKPAATIPIVKSADPFADLLSQSDSLPPPSEPGEMLVCRYNL